MSPSLRELQSRIKAAVISGRFDELDRYVDADRLTAAQRVGIHRNHTRTSLASALADNFPVTCRLVGRDFFAAAAQIYVEAELPSDPRLWTYGATFPDFLESFEPARSLAYLPDTARLERLRIEVTHAAVGRALDLRSLARLTPDQQRNLPLALLSTVRLLRSRYPVDRIWQANQVSEPPPVDLGDDECRLVIARTGAGCRIERIDMGRFAFFEAAARSDTLAQAIDIAQAAGPEFDLAGALATHRARDVLADTIATGHGLQKGKA
jgi:hypothetical protein